MKYYKGRYTPKNSKKYQGDPTKIVYRSMWERQAFKFLDEHPNVVKWGSETVVVPYICKTDSKRHRYFVDLCVTFQDGRCYLIEIKPKKQTQPPKQRSRKTKKYLNEVMTYAKNISKWEAAEAYAHRRGMIFQIWDEDTLKGLGIKLLT